MGLFSKNKSKEKSGAPMPPPPAPNKPSSSSSQQDSAAKEEASKQNTGALASPPIPSGSLDDIRNQVTAPTFSNQNSEENKESKPQSSSSNSSSSMDNSSNDMEDVKLSDSLFDLSDLSMPETDKESDEETNTLNSHDGIHQHRDRSDTNALTTPPYSHEELEDRSFVKRVDHEHHVNPNDDYFVTTSQFKAMLEIVESVKNKVKDSSERHLRLLDIKSEEDIEFENLRKDFQYIEDKLYEVDSIIFDN